MELKLTNRDKLRCFVCFVIKTQLSSPLLNQIWRKDGSSATEITREKMLAHAACSRDSIVKTCRDLGLWARNRQYRSTPKELYIQHFFLIIATRFLVGRNCHVIIVVETTIIWFHKFTKYFLNPRHFWILRSYLSSNSATFLPFWVSDLWTSGHKRGLRSK